MRSLLIGLTVLGLATTWVSAQQKQEKPKGNAPKAKPFDPTGKNNPFKRNTTPPKSNKSAFGGGGSGKSPFGNGSAKSGFGNPKSPFGPKKTTQPKPVTPGSRNGTSPFGTPATNRKKNSVPNPFAKKQAPAAGPFAGIGSGTSNKPVRYHWKVGIEAEAKSGLAGNLWGTVPVPSEWPEQTVKIVKREVSPHIRKFRMRTLRDGVEQMYFEIPRLAPGEKAKALLTYEIVKKPVPLPENAESFVIPDRPPRKVTKHLGASPMIESRNPSIRVKAKELTESFPTGWEKAKAIYDFVRDDIEFREGKLKGAAAALKDGFGQKEDLVSLFIALCRATRIPARTVWVPNHVYAEFYLDDAEGNGHWLPVEMAGDRHFGFTKDIRPILQRGDKFEVPEKKAPQRYVAELLKGKAGAGLLPPSHQFIRELTTVTQ